MEQARQLLDRKRELDEDADRHIRFATELKAQAGICYLDARDLMDGATVAELKEVFGDGRS